MTENNSSDTYSDDTEQEYEYRVFGATPGGYRVTEWGSRERAVYVFEACGWSMTSIERREPGDDKTIHRKPKPSDDDWMHVTDENVHLADDEVAEA